MDLPFPDQPWYRFEAFPIGPHLPPSRKAKGYTPEMCIPIYPNSNHPTGREPVHPERPFPYGNCYHWIATKVRIRVRGRPEGFDETNAISLSTKTELLMGSTFRNDYLRAMENADVQSRPAAYDHGDAIPRPSMGRPPRSAVGDAESASHRQEDDMDAASVSSRSSRSGRSIRRPMTSVEDIMAMDIFTGPAEDLYLVPLVDLWPELANNLKEEDIPSPLELYREIEMIQE
ncbi:hypothetical protein TRAPUB_2633 [Trametes pubescens]|uniref:Uncharacterized protein n=1 Tax=Trametes pubescens TaxID=154538 RepID=A0A1M2VG75_TRAPU|nr:hypothetical protein TRAPUB_2633 [Trametes pubescens]